MAAVSRFRNFIFGVEDSLVSTVGLLSGIAIAAVPVKTIFLTGVVLIFVEAFSMAAGSFLSESSAEEYRSSTVSPISKKNALASALIMFCSYFVSGFIPLSAYLIWPVGTALVYSVLFSVCALFILGAIGATVSGTNIFKNAFRMGLIGGGAVAIGLIAGTIVSNLA